jgi:L-seryl-tRNA(Ser) seleniumtransferase
VLVSRGQLGESAGGERLAAVIQASGVVLREIGSANRTRVEDFSGAVTPRSAAIIHAAAGDYEVSGNKEQPSLADLVSAGRRHNLPVIDISAAGAVLDFYRYGVRGQTVVSESMRAGASLVLFGGDRLLGGPECGIIAGRRSLVEPIEAHVLYRAVQADKLRLAALSATLRLIADGDLAERTVPVVSLLSTSVENLRQRASRLAPQMAATGVADVAVVDGSSYVLGSPLEDQKLPTVLLAVAPKAGTAQQLANRLQSGATPVIGRVEADRLLLDLRSVSPREDMALVAAFEALRPAATRPTGTETPPESSAEE